MPSGKPTCPPDSATSMANPESIPMATSVGQAFQPDCPSDFRSEPNCQARKPDVQPASIRRDLVNVHQSVIDNRQPAAENG